jgi:hypothetical protein
MAIVLKPEFRSEFGSYLSELDFHEDMRVLEVCLR